MLGKDVTSTKRFLGKTYHLFVTASNKRQALREAARLRKNGYNARIYVGLDMLGVYSYPKTPHWYSGVYLKKRKG